ncbi:hypothetical protein [Streptomyces sp. YIM S03343]
MSNKGPTHQRSALAYAIAADPYWSTAGTTRLDGALALPERRASRSAAGTPYNLTVYDLALELDEALASFAHRYGSDDVPAGRTAVAAYAAQLAEQSPAARRSYGRLRLIHDLKAALSVGEADGILGRISCPACLCWSLVGTRTPDGAWAVACSVARCAVEPGEPRVFTLVEIAQHHLTTDRDAHAA